MRRNRTSESQRPMLRLVGDGEERSGSASKIYGCESHASITTHRIQSQALSESLNSLDSQIQDLESRYLEVCATLNIVMSDLVKRGLFGIKINTTDVVE